MAPVRPGLFTRIGEGRPGFIVRDAGLMPPVVTTGARVADRDASARSRVPVNATTRATGPRW